MTQSRNWKAIGETIGIAAIVASLIFVGMQLYQTQNIAYAELQNEMIANRVALNDQIIGSVEILVKANRGNPLTDEEQIVVYRLVDSYWGEGFWGYQRWKFVDHPAVLSPMRAFANFLYENPGARHAWAASAISKINIGSQKEFNELVRSRLAELDAGKPVSDP